MAGSAPFRGRAFGITEDADDPAGDGAVEGAPATSSDWPFFLSGTLFNGPFFSARELLRDDDLDESGGIAPLTALAFDNGRALTAAGGGIQPLWTTRDGGTGCKPGHTVAARPKRALARGGGGGS